MICAPYGTVAACLWLDISIDNLPDPTDAMKPTAVRRKRVCTSAGQTFEIVSVVAGSLTSCVQILRKKLRTDCTPQAIQAQGRQNSSTSNWYQKHTLECPHQKSPKDRAVLVGPQ